MTRGESAVCDPPNPMTRYLQLLSVQLRNQTLLSLYHPFSPAVGFVVRGENHHLACSLFLFALTHQHATCHSFSRPIVRKLTENFEI